MKQLMVFGFAVILFGIASCEQKVRDTSNGRPQLQIQLFQNPSFKVWDGNAPSNESLPDFFPDKTQTGAFPESMVGVWETKKGGERDYEWGFKFERDGSISKIVHFFAGEIDLKEGGTHWEGKEPNSFAAFIMGPCEAKYDTNTHELKVKTILDYYQIKLPEGQLEGRNEDYFQGSVSDDGETWKVKWRSYAWLKGATPPDVNYITTNPESLVFHKVDLAQIRRNDNAQ